MANKKTMKNILLILKGILLYTTIISIIITICGIEDIVENNKLLFPVISIIGVIACYKLLSSREIDKLLFMDFFKNID